MTQIELARDILLAMIQANQGQISSMIVQTGEENGVKMARIAAKAAKVLLEEAEK